MMIKSGIDANRVKKPNTIRTPQVISKHAENEAQNSGFVNPILVNLPVPTNSGRINF
jgi:hypothetical protein